MSKTFRRFEILLPLRFNDGRNIPAELMELTLHELREQFGPMSCETQTTQGTWSHELHEYHDDSIRVYIDTPDLAEHRAFFVEYKETLKARFEQIDIWLTTFPVEVL